MKRGNLKSFVLGVLVCALVLGIGIPALASSTVVNADLYYNDIKIRLNGQEITPKDAQGNLVEPFIIDGTTYLPVRAIANTLGLSVSWSGEAHTVILGNEPEYNQPAAWLGDLNTFAGYAKETLVTYQQYDNIFTANSGDKFDRYLNVGAGTGATYLLKGQYKRFTGTAYLPEYDKNVSTEFRLLVYADDTLVYTSPTVTSGVAPVEFSVDLNSCYELKLVREWRIMVNKSVNCAIIPIA